MKLKKKCLYETFEVRGRFKLDGNSYEGVFKSDGSHFRLAFTKSAEKKFEDKIGQLYFSTSRGEMLILNKGLLAKTERHFRGLDTLEYLFTEFWLSVDHASIPASFMGGKIKFSGLKAYALQSPFHIEYEFYDNTYKVQVSENLKTEITSDIADRTLSVVSHGQIKSNQYQELSFQYENWLRLDYTDKHKKDECIHDLLDLVYLYSFITNERHQVEEIILMSYNKKTKANEHFKLFMNLPYEFTPYHKTSHTYEINAFLNQYFKVIYKFYCAHKSLFDDTFNSFMDLLYTTKFVNHYLAELLKISEGVHRRFTGKKSTTLKKRYEDMLSSLDIELITYLKSLVHYNKSLNKYLKNYRNYYSHYFPSLDKPIYQHDTDERIGEYVVQLHKAFILTQIGIPPREIIKLLKVTHIEV
ncbi:HEPN domain-containing protein [Staphylococcus simulans]